MKQLICCFIKVQPARSGPRHSQRPEKENFARSAPRGAKPVFVRLWRPNGVNFNGTAHLLFHQSSASPEWPETPRCAARKGIPHRSAPRGAKPVFVRLWRTNGVNLHLTVASRQMNVPPARSGSKHSLRREKNSLTAAHPRGAKPVFARPPAAKRRELQWNSSSAVPSKFSQPGVARNTSLRPGVCPPPAAKRREPPFDGCVPSNECSASPQWPETPRCAAKRIPLHRSALRGAKPVFVRLWRTNGVNLHLTVASRQMNVQPARSGPEALALPRCLSALGGQTA